MNVLLGILMCDENRKRIISYSLCYKARLKCLKRDEGPNEPLIRRCISTSVSQGGKELLGIGVNLHLLKFREKKELFGIEKINFSRNRENHFIKQFSKHFCESTNHSYSL